MATEIMSYKNSETQRNAKSKSVFVVRVEVEYGF